MNTKLSDKARRGIGFLVFVLTIVDLPLMVILVLNVLADDRANSVFLTEVVAALNGPLFLTAFIIALLDVKQQTGQSIQSQLYGHIKDLWHESEFLFPILRWSWRWLYLSCMFALFNILPGVHDLSEKAIDEILNKSFSFSGLICITCATVWLAIKLARKIQRDWLLRQALKEI